MGMFDGILGNVSQHADVENLATKVGLSPEQTEQAIAALAVAHQQEGDTVAAASAKTGIDQSKLSEIVEQIGGEGSLGEFARQIADHPEAQGLLSKFL